MKKTLFLLMICLALMGGCKNNDPAANIPSKDDSGANTADMDKTVQPYDSVGSTVNHGEGESVKAPEGDIVEIREKMFIAQTNDIYYNAEDYLGKTIKYEGIFDSYTDPETDKSYYYVIRYGPGCCGIDENAGFEVTWDKGYPSSDDWVEAVGVLEAYEEDGYNYLRVVLSSLTVLDERGAEYVSQ